MKGKYKIGSGYCGCDRWILPHGTKCPFCKRRFKPIKVKKRCSVEMKEQMIELIYNNK